MDLEELGPAETAKPDSGSARGIEQPPVPDLVTPLTIANLAATKGWVRFVSVVGFVAAGISVLLGLLGLVLGGTAQSLGPGLASLLCLVYLAGAGIYLYLSLTLHRYAVSIGDLLRTRQPADLEAALGHQRRFWRFVGVLTIVAVAFWVVALAVAFVLGMLAALVA